MTKLLRLSAVCLMVAASHAGATVLYSPTEISSSARISDYGSVSQTGFRSFDNFSVVPGGSVEKVTWTGFWLDLANPIPAAAPAPDVLSWDIAFYADNAGTPGAQLSLQSFDASAVSSTYLGSGVFTVGGSYNVDFYRYSVDLTTAFNLLPSTQYWISVLSRSESYLPAFALRGAEGGDNASYQQTLGAALSVVSSTSVARDRAFVLEGTMVPEPGTLSVAAAGLLLLPLLRRRSRG